MDTTPYPHAGCCRSPQWTGVNPSFEVLGCDCSRSPSGHGIGFREWPSIHCIRADANCLFGAGPGTRECLSTLAGAHFTGYKLCRDCNPEFEWSVIRNETEFIIVTDWSDVWCGSKDGPRCQSASRCTFMCAKAAAVNADCNIKARADAWVDRAGEDEPVHVRGRMQMLPRKGVQLRKRSRVGAKVKSKVNASGRADAMSNRKMNFKASPT
jgi:hypothetical protein